MRKVVNIEDGDVSALVFDTDTGLLEVHDSCESRPPLIQAKLTSKERSELAQVLTDPGDGGT